MHAMLYSAANMTETEDAQRLAELLRLKIITSGHSQREVERRLDWGKGYISQLLRGSFDLKVKHVYSILEVIGIAPRAFFAELYQLAPASVSTATAFPGGATWPLPGDLETLRPHLEGLIREILEAERERQAPPGRPGRSSA